MYHFGSGAPLPEAGTSRESGKSLTMSKLVRMGVLQYDDLVVPPRKKVLHGLHRVRPAHDLHGDLEAKIQPGSNATAIPTRKENGRVELLIRLWLKSPWEDYQAIKTSNGLTVAGRKRSYFKMATVRSFASLGALETLERFSDVRHPNIAPVHDLYYFSNRLYIVGEYLELSLTKMDFQSFQLEEWEIATITTEVRRQ
jgi:hypothetical protein